ncbi:hypothetical protein GCM10007907_33570 [Chitinimonas prasina]|uniref:Prokaryotic glutathione synthetase ATP-binding domain-containing protein n=1 Tax=Chitinimonas prasina TaxID=1434937 RepID=A0ABQ5YHU2_9NEIS|nr:hypothetical protein [Chitinimonas prasina]GLR14567.1 hypothetical protein GCM10007907_33570 [Chitinimonas prasina]
MDVTLVTAGPYLAAQPDDWYVSQIHHEERLLATALAALGLQSQRADWADGQVDWRKTRCAVLRSTWDYFHRYDAFSAWLAGADVQTMLLNPLPLLRWNIDKHYLADLAQAGVAIVPTRFVARGDSASLVQLAAEQGWDAVVFKPAVSGSARLTYRATGSELLALQSVFAACVAGEDMLLQPFQPEILALGEVSLMVMDGRYTHAIRKMPKAGDFRVQDDHGGTVQPYVPSRAEVAFAEAAVAACPSLPAYARVDFVVTPEGCRLMELELIEPELFLRFHPPAADALAAAIARRLDT